MIQLDLFYPQNESNFYMKKFGCIDVTFWINLNSKIELIECFENGKQLFSYFPQYLFSVFEKSFLADFIKNDLQK